MSQSLKLTVPDYGDFLVFRRTAQMELQIAIEKDRLLQEHLRQNNSLDASRPVMTVADLSPSTVNFFTLFATFSQTIDQYPDAFDPAAFMTEWSRDDAFEFLNAYLDALSALERSFRRRPQSAVDAGGVESPSPTPGPSVES